VVVVAILKVKECRGSRYAEDYVYYIPTWRITQVVADSRGISIYTEAIRAYGDGASESDYARIMFDDDIMRKIDKKDRLKIAEAVAEEIVKLIGDRSAKIIDAEEFRVKMKVLS
jgi:hypothetical protein